MAEDQIFFVGQKAFIEKDGKVLVLFDDRNKLDLPGGKIQEGERDLRASLLREIYEETGLTVSVGVPFTSWSFALPDHHRHAGKSVFLVGFKCAWTGGDIKLSNDHLRYEWISKNDLWKLESGSGHFDALKTYFA